MKQKYDDGKFGKRLTDLIEGCNTSNAKVAEKLGVSAQAVGNMIKTGRIDYNNLRKLAELFDVNWVWLRYGPTALADVVKDAADGTRNERRERLSLLRKMAELEEEHFHLLLMLERLPIVMWETDANNVFTLSQGHGLSVLGLAPDEVVGHTVKEIYGSSAEIMELQARALAGETNTKRCYVGDTIWDAYCRPVYEDKAIVGTMGIAILKESQ